MEKRCYYDILGVTFDATDDDIKRSYKKLALTLHPDKNPQNVENANREFTILQKAYDVLSDPKERSWYAFDCCFVRHSRYAHSGITSIATPFFAVTIAMTSLTMRSTFTNISRLFVTTRSQTAKMDFIQCIEICLKGLQRKISRTAMAHKKCPILADLTPTTVKCTHFTRIGRAIVRLRLTYGSANITFWMRQIDASRDL